MLKAECGCGYTIRITRKWAQLGLPCCPLDGERLTCDALDDGEDDSEEMRAA